MKIKVLLVIVSIFICSCNNKQKTTETSWLPSALKSDVLMQSAAVIPFSGKENKDFAYLTLSGKTILNCVATFQALNDKGEEIHCETFPVSHLIAPEYRTANSTLIEEHIRTVVRGFFVDELAINSLANL